MSKGVRNGKDFNFHKEVEKSGKYQGIKNRMGESQDSFLTQETMTTSATTAADKKGAQKACCQWNPKTMTITSAVSFALVLCLVALIIRFHANVRPDEKYASVGTIPFPAVTICPGIRSGYPKNNFNRTLFLMQTEAQPKLRPRKKIALETLFQLCDWDIFRRVRNWDILERYVDEDDQIEAFNSIACDIDENAKFCAWHRRTSCDEYFRPIITDEGRCYTFNLLNSYEIFTQSMSFPLIRNWKNSLNSSYWNREVGYTDTETASEYYPFRVFDTDSKIFPYRVSGAGPDNALNISIYFPRDELDPLCNRSARDIKFYLHSPDELPEPSHYFHIPIGKRVSVSVKPNVIVTSNDLRSFSPWRRQCYFNDERKLRFFKVYTQRHCEIECLANFTKSRCGCVKFSMPRDNSTRICGVAKMRCYHDAEWRLADNFGWQSSYLKKCNCLPACASIKYDVDIKAKGLRMNKNLVKGKIGFQVPRREEEERSQLLISFKDDKFIPNVRIQYTVLDFLKNFYVVFFVIMAIVLVVVFEALLYCIFRLGRAWGGRKALTREGNERYVPETVSKAVSRGSDFDMSADNDEQRNRKKERCQWCGNHIKTTIVLGSLLVLCLASGLLTHLFIYWSKYLVKVRPDDKVMSIGAIPFPAVTICPGTRAGYPPLNFTHLLRLMQVYREPQLKLDEKYAMETLFQIYPEDIVDSVRSPEFLERFSREEYQFGIFGLISTRITEYTKSCKWQNEKIACNANFRPIITEEGKCFSFNLLSSYEIFTQSMASPLVRRASREDDYDENDRDPEAYPYRVLRKGQNNGLAISIFFDKDLLDIFSRRWVSEPKFILHSPDEMPRTSNFFRIPMGKDVKVLIKPQMITTSEKLRNFSPKRRQCVYDSERKLRYFKTYTQNHCDMECASNFTYWRCGCVKFSLPRGEEMSICGAGRMHCYREAEDELLRRSTLEECNCLPACTSTDYNVEISEREFDEFNRINADLNYQRRDENKVSRVTLYFKDDLFKTLRREEAFYTAEFILEFGGLHILTLGIILLLFMWWIVHLVERKQRNVN